MDVTSTLKLQGTQLLCHKVLSNPSKKNQEKLSNFYLGLDLLTRLGRFVCFSVFLKDVTADWSLIGKAFLFMGSSENQLSLKLDSMADFQNCRKKWKMTEISKFQEIQELKNHKIKNG